MIERYSSHAISHSLVRWVTLITVANFGLSTFWRSYFEIVGHGRLGKGMALWSILSSFLLPIYVGFEILWMRKKGDQKKALYIDAGLVAVWLLVFWSSAAFAFGHYVPF
jgi:hypothetical protein